MARRASKGVARYRARMAERERILVALRRAHGLYHMTSGFMAFGYVVLAMLVKRGELPWVVSTVLILAGMAGTIWADVAVRRGITRRTARELLGKDAEPPASLLRLRAQIDVRGDDDPTPYGVEGLEARTQLYSVLFPALTVVVAGAVLFL